LKRNLESEEPLNSAPDFFSSSSQGFSQTLYPNVTLAEWNDWRWQLNNCIADVQALSRLITLSPADAVRRISSSEPSLRITPIMRRFWIGKSRSSATKIRGSHSDEFVFSPGESRDPLCEDDHSPVPGLVHGIRTGLYFWLPHLFDLLPVLHPIADGRETRQCVKQSFRWSAALIISSPFRVRDVLISGGDPLTLPDDVLESIVQRLRRIRHVE